VLRRLYVGQLRIDNSAHSDPYINIRVGEPPIHPRPGSPENEAGLSQFREEEGVTLSGVRPR
jgi:hypothetical protein